MSYCTFCSGREEDDYHRIYHDNHYGFPIEDDDELFGRLLLEINQAGLSWDLMLKKEAHFRAAFDQFSIEKVAQYDDEKIDELMNNAGIVRNKLKIRAAIYNAQQLVQLKRDLGSFKQWLDNHHPKSKEEWTKLFKKSFKFVGGEIVNEFLMSTGYLKGAHDETCSIYSKTINNYPKWLEK
jgi:DNA-3-methyladenine glycosylase I